MCWFGLIWGVRVWVLMCWLALSLGCYGLGFNVLVRVDFGVLGFGF